MQRQRTSASVLYKSIILFLILIIIGLILFPRPLQQVSRELAEPGNETLKTIHNRKSVRHYLDKPISKEQLGILVSAGMAAPTAGDRRPWAFIVITDKKTLVYLGENLPYGAMLKQAGAAIIVCGIPGKSYPGIEQAFWIQDCSAATENILLATESLGLGAVWIGIYPSPQKVTFIQKSFGIPPEVIPLNIVSIGYPTGEEQPKNKFDTNNIHWGKW